ncbi:MAG TPA: pirin family protein [Acidimicrobiales bacterium]|nr:pirin family protein [Acidimicrobiales bacterium]
MNSTGERTISRIHPIVPMGSDGQVDKKAAVLPPGYFEMFDPFLLMFEDWFSTPGFDWHPHRGIETVTVVVDGALEHGDSRGNAGVLAPGGIQWMTAGNGIIHREMAHRDEHVHTLQLWVNLPSTHKMVDSRYQDFTPDTMATHDDGRGARLELVSGRTNGIAGPADNHHPITGGTVRLEPGATITLDLPSEDRAFVYALTGNVTVGAQRAPLAAGEVAWSDPDPSATQLTLAASAEQDAPATLVTFSGRPINERIVARGPFVMNDEAEIAAAYTDFRSGRFGDIPRLARVP